MKITAEQIPDNVVEAAIMPLPLNVSRAEVRASIVDALNAWEGAVTLPTNDFKGTCIRLPLPTPQKQETEA